MHRTLPLVLTLVATALPRPALAQPDAAAPPTVAMSFWQCDRAAMDQLIEAEQTRSLPIYQSLVDSGQMFEAGAMTHAWGDEWNFVLYVVAQDLAAAVAANSAIQSAYAERWPDDNLLVESCTGHFDNIYTARTGEGFTGAVSPDDPATVALSFWQCPLHEVGRLMEEEGRGSAVIAQELTNEGLWRGSGFMTHAWGDVWNVVRYSAADDLPSLLTAFDAMGERMESRFPGMAATNVNATCSQHKDNIYDLVVRTTQGE